MQRKITYLFLAIFLLSPQISYANPVNSSSDVSATVPSESFAAPNLISPPNNHASNSARFIFNWRRPSPLPSTTLDHYDLYIDDAVFAAAISDTLSTADYYFYTATRASEFFYVGLKQDLAQGYHTWRVAVFDTIGTNTATGNWTFYIDSIAPFISLTKVNSTSYSWNTSVNGSIPTENNRYLTTSSNNPTLKGNVETNANMQISLVCPSGAPTGCTNQSWIINSTDGNWEKQFSGLIANINYSVLLSATDATNNTTIFPTFYLKYPTSAATPTTQATTTPTPNTTLTPTITQTPLPTLTATPNQSPLPSITTQLTPPPDLSALVTPTQFIPRTPPAPTLPPQKTEKPKTNNGYGFIILLILLCLGLPTHLAIATIGVGANISQSISFILTLGFPFLKRKNTTTAAFSFIEFYNPNKLNKPILKGTSDINGNFYIPTDMENEVLVTLKNTNYNWKNQLISKNQVLSSCLRPSPKSYLAAKERLQNNLYSAKSIPLSIAILTSSVGLYFYPSLYLGIYLLISMQYTFSEYVYPKIS